MSETTSHPTEQEEGYVYEAPSVSVIGRIEELTMGSMNKTNPDILNAVPSH